jgi:hypothetical protein
MQLKCGVAVDSGQDGQLLNARRERVGVRARQDASCPRLSLPSPSPSSSPPLYRIDPLGGIVNHVSKQRMPQIICSRLSDLPNSASSLKLQTAKLPHTLDHLIIEPHVLCRRYAGTSSLNSFHIHSKVGTPRFPYTVPLPSSLQRHMRRQGLLIRAACIAPIDY